MQPLDDIWQLRIEHVPESTDFIASQCMLAPPSVYLICGTSEGERPERRQRMARVGETFCWIQDMYIKRCTKLPVPREMPSLVQSCETLGACMY